MTDEKRYMLAVILKYLFGDEQSSIGNQINDFRVEFTRPIATSIYNRFIITWTQNGDFRLLGVVGKEKPIMISVSNWFKVGHYLKMNYIKARRHLGIQNI